MDKMSSVKNVRLPTGCKPLDDLLDGGIEYQAITNVYGPAGAGKTNVALLSTLAALRANKKVIYVDTEGGFSPERIAQLCNGTDVGVALKNILLFEPKSFKDQCEVAKKLEKLIEKENVGLIVVDSLVALYRLDMGNGGHAEANKRLSEQMALLSKISREHNIPVLITNQIYTDFDNRAAVELVSRDVARYWSKCLVELIRVDDRGRRLAVLRKHRSLPEGREAQLQITETGIEESRGFKLFG